MRLRIVVCGLALVSLLASTPLRAQSIAIDKDTKSVIIPCTIAPRKLPHLDKTYPIEVIATNAYRQPKGSDVRGQKGPDDWGVNIDAHVTVVVATKSKVAATIGYMSLNETDVPKVQEALKRAVDGK